MINLSIVIPCYNESKNIPLILSRFEQVITSPGIELVLVDNGSQDETQAILSDLLPKYNFARSVLVEVNQGYGHGILAGLNAAEGEFLAWTHADMQTDPYDVVKAWGIISRSSQPDLLYIKGERKKRPLFDQFFTIGMSFFESLLLRCALWDINAQPNVFHRSFYESWASPPSDFSLDLYAYYMAKNQGLKVQRFDVFFPERIHGESSWNNGLLAKWKFIKRTMIYSLQLKKNL